MSVAGLVTRPCTHDPHQTLQLAVAAITAHGMSILGRVDHAAAAAQAGLVLRATQVLIFGNPLAGTPLMQSVQTLGIDLPLRLLVWQDKAGDTWVSYNDPAWLADRHGVPPAQQSIVTQMARALAQIAEQAAGQVFTSEHGRDANAGNHEAGS